MGGFRMQKSRACSQRRRTSRCRDVELQASNARTGNTNEHARMKECVTRCNVLKNHEAEHGAVRCGRRGERTGDVVTVIIALLCPILKYHSIAEASLVVFGDMDYARRE